MADFLPTVTSAVSATLGWMGSVVDFIKDEPLILLPIIAFFFVGGAIGLVNRLIRG